MPYFEQRKISTMPKYGNHHVITSNSPVLLLQAAPRTGHKNNPVAAATVAERSSVSDSILRCCEEKWPACYAHSGSNLPRPILIFVAAKENGFACYGRSGNDVRVRFYSSFPQRRMVPSAAVVAETMSASDSNLRCGKEEWFRLQTATNPRLQ